jgi:hypothetical protein
MIIRALARIPTQLSPTLTQPAPSDNTDLSTDRNQNQTNKESHSSIAGRLRLIFAFFLLLLLLLLLLLSAVLPPLPTPRSLFAHLASVSPSPLLSRLLSITQAINSMLDSNSLPKGRELCQA